VKKVLVIGSNGFLGASLVITLKPLFELITVTRKSPNSDYNVDMAHSTETACLLSRVKPDFIINLAALTNVDLCEADFNLAYRINSKIVENIARYSNDQKDVFVVHVSTDHIYDGENSSEDDVVICNAYAMTKYCGEKSFKADNAVVLRTNFFGKSLSQSSEGLCNSIYNRAVTGQQLKLFNDVYFSPVSINTLCDVVLLCLEKKIAGVFNVGSKEGMSKERFLKKFLEFSGLKNVEYLSISADDTGFKTPRPKDMRMDVSLFEKMFEYKLPQLIDEIPGVANEFKK
jgi:dTDP-4-dehydrorhamnose reductase